jgi:RNA polymerase sigma-70 factor (ECF subfamily)
MPMTPALDPWSSFYDRIHRFVSARVPTRSDADDLVQSILERSIAKSTSTEVDNALGWLFGIARNAIADHYRSRARSLCRSADDLEKLASPMGDSDEERAEVVACVEPLLDMVAPDVAQLLRWADMQGRSMQAISEDLQISLTATKSRVQRARKVFLEAASACCALTVDARQRVMALAPRGDCATVCSGCGPETTRRA